MSANRYLDAAATIPRGQTRSYLELAAMALRCGAARAAARALRACAPDAPVPWHRVVAADGSLHPDAERAALQLARLRREGARPRRGEGIEAWARRVGAALVGRLPERVHAPPHDPAVAGWGPLGLEPLRGRAQALARGFTPLGVERRDAPALPTALPRGRGAGGRPPRSLAERIAAVDWDAALERIAAKGLAHLPGLLSPAECGALLGEGGRSEHIERTVRMRPRGYGVGIYHYWREPPPEPVRELRSLLYRRLQPAAARLRSPRGDVTYPSTLAGYQRACRAAGQRRGSCLILAYGEGGLNHPHRDLFGKLWFPLQVLVVLSRRGRDFEGGEFVLLEERGDGLVRRRVPVSQGDLVIFLAAARWERRGGRWRKVPVLHAMDAVRRGTRFAAGIVFHLAR